MKNKTNSCLPAPNAAPSAPSPMRKNSAASGSALIVVLGMLAVLMIMGTTFSVFMRTERSGTTNLKHSLTARQATLSALSRVMANIDESFGDPENSAAASQWVWTRDAAGNSYPWKTSTSATEERLPFIASSDTLTRPDTGRPLFWESALMDVRADNTTPINPLAKTLRPQNARILTKEMSEHLTPSQIALTKNAVINWLPIYSGIRSGAYRPDYNAPENDTVVARYAFIAFDSTGLLDMNHGGGDNLTDDIVVGSTSGGGTSFGRFLYDKGSPNHKNFVAVRDAAGGFTSFAELWRHFMNREYDATQEGGSDLMLDPINPTSNPDLFTPDLFTPFAMSVESMAPDGKMKLPLPADTTSAGAKQIWETKTPGSPTPQKIAFAKLANEKFNSVFVAENTFFTNYTRISNSSIPPTLSKTPAGVPQVRLPEITRAQLATQALVDYLDPDDIPDGGIFDNNNSFSYLDYPCTENVPMITGAAAYVELLGTTPNDNGTPAPEDDTVEYVFGISVIVVAKPQSADLAYEGTYEIQGEFEYLNLGEQIGLAFFENNGSPNSGPIHRDVSFSQNGGSSYISLSASGDYPWVTHSKPKPIEMRSYSAKEELTAGYDKDRIKVVVKAEVDPTGVFVKMPALYDTLEDPNKSTVKRIDLDIRLNAKVVNTVTKHVVHQVPAPAFLEPMGPQRHSFFEDIKEYQTDYRIRLRPALFERGRTVDVNRGFGWAFCIDPRFAYDTKGFNNLFFYNPGDLITWISNHMTRDADLAYNGVDHNAQTPDGKLYANNAMFGNILANIVSQLNKNDVEGTISLGNGQGEDDYIKNMLYNVFRNNSTIIADVPDGAEKTWWELAGGVPIYPDVFHSESLRTNSVTGRLFCGRTDRTPGRIFSTKIANSAMQSMAGFGNLLIGPWETLSLMAAFAPNGTLPTGSAADNPNQWAQSFKTDFHRVADYFTLSEPRWPKLIDTVNPSEGLLSIFSGSDKITSAAWKQKWDSLDREYLGGVSSEKLNLNAQPLVKCNDLISGSGRPTADRNYEPLATVITTAPTFNSVSADRLTFNDSKDVADAFYQNVVGTSAGAVFDGISDIGAAAKNADDNPFEPSPMLKAIINANSSRNGFIDADREAFVGGVLDKISTRGQSYTVVLRSDAYSPKFGTDDMLGGTTLATEYAIVDLWRDSEPARRPNGWILGVHDSGGAAVDFNTLTTSEKEAQRRNITHAWHIRSIRYFSP